MFETEVQNAKKNPNKIRDRLKQMGFLDDKDQQGHIVGYALWRQKLLVQFLSPIKRDKYKPSEKSIRVVERRESNEKFFAFEQ